MTEEDRCIKCSTLIEGGGTWGYCPDCWDDDLIVMTPFKTVVIGSYWLSAIFNDDTTALDDGQEVMLEEWMKPYPQDCFTMEYVTIDHDVYGNIVKEMEIEFSQCQISNKWADCCTLNIYRHRVPSA